MSQAAFLRALDADMASAFANCGMADAAQYTAPGGGAAVDCTVFVDDVAVDGAGDQSRTVATRRHITLHRAEVSMPVQGGTVEVDDVVWRLATLVTQDESLSTWVVTRVRA